MLKIKEEVDLKELEKFGFKPKYSEENGELVEYFFVNNKETSISKFLGISIIKKDTSLRNKKIRTINALRLDFTDNHGNFKIITIDYPSETIYKNEEG